MSAKGPDTSKLLATHRPSWRTLVDMLRGVGESAPDRGIYLTDERGSQEFRTYSQITEGALRVGAGLANKGIQRHDRIILALPSSFDFIEAFFGAMSIGATPIPIAPPVEYPGESRTDQAEFFIRFSERMNASSVIFRTTVGSAVKPPKYGALKHVTDLPDLLEGVPVGSAPSSDSPLPTLAYIQTTSGETATRGTVELSHRGVLANLEAVGKALEVTEDDFGVSWLPLFNTMGLVGGFLFNLYWGLDMALIAPERFMRRPEEWLHAISRHEGTLSVAPSFAYHYTVRRCQRSQLHAIDLSSWRVAMVGGELVRRMHIDAFERRFRECNFDRDALLPVYGLAEASLAVSFGDVNERLKLDVIDRRGLEFDDIARPTGTDGPLHERAEYVSVGTPLGDVDIRIVDDEANDLAEREIGEVAVRSPSLFEGYFDEPESRNEIDKTRLEGSWLMTGDMGYRVEGELFVVGRKSERIVMPDGRKVFPEDIELVAQTIDGVRNGAVVAFEADGRVVLAFEAQEGAGESDLAKTIEARLDRYLKLKIEFLGLSPHSIPRSPSGKIRRHLCRAFFLAGNLDRRDRAGDFEGLRRILTRSRLELLKLGQKVSDRVSSILSKGE